MKLVAYPQAAAGNDLHVWVGAFGAATKDVPLTFTINGQVTTPIVPATFAPIRDAQISSNGAAQNYRAICVLPRPANANGPYRVQVSSGEESCTLTTNALPGQLPPTMAESFNILLCSCYYQPRDKERLLGDVISQIKLTPHLTVMAGDQIYADLPLGFNGASLDDFAAHLGEKYRKNWLSSTLGSSGLGPSLTRAPVVCIPDDHEFWNNFPYRQAQIPPTWTQSSRDAWTSAAQHLYEDYQVSDASANGAARFDIDPVKMLFLDMRTARDNDFKQLMSATALAAFDQWIADLLATPGSAGLLSSGQSLFIDKPGDLDRHIKDAEMPNYAQFDHVQAQLALLASKNVPVLYLTGDVHWSRIAEGRDVASGTSVYEVISSPSVLIDDPSDIFGSIKESLFGASKPWPHHSPAKEAPGQFGPGGRIRVTKGGPSRIGDQVAMVSLARTGGGVSFQVTYYGVSRDKTLSQSQTFGPFRLR